MNLRAQPLCTAHLRRKRKEWHLLCLSWAFVVGCTTQVSASNRGERHSTSLWEMKFRFVSAIAHTWHHHVTPALTPASNCQAIVYHFLHTWAKWSHNLSNSVKTQLNLAYFSTIEISMWPDGWSGITVVRYWFCPHYFTGIECSYVGREHHIAIISDCSIFKNKCWL